MKKILTLIFLLIFTNYTFALGLQPKREFRGAWIQIINGQFMGMSRKEMQNNLVAQLDSLQKCHINTIIFQVRAEADAMYPSLYEPWSIFLTGVQGMAPHPYWDPLAWIIYQCHKRGMELHAWINPFRAKTKTTLLLAHKHPYYLHPERFIAYDRQYIFDPGLPENRNYICTVVEDIVSRYDVDGIHIDDYFYPYPNGTTFNDLNTYKKYNQGIKDIGDWRRSNVNLFIKQLYTTIKTTKPWVKFGISPFGIYHNFNPNTNIPGSATKGLQNYDDLYADILLWMQNGWVDYVVPQIYWNFGNKAADYQILAQWWNRFGDLRPVIIGQDIVRSVQASDPQYPHVNQLPRKFNLQRSLPGIQGSCLWYSAAVVNNTGNSALLLRKVFHPFPALPPLMPFIDNHAPKKVKGLTTHYATDGIYLFWRLRKTKKEMDRAVNFVVYRFKKGDKIDINNPANIVCITPENILKLPYVNGKTKYVYVVTALDRLQNESKIKKKTVKL